jgi:predicted AlkP superfamily pyrophosphatase or phosphodiesterase
MKNYFAFLVFFIFNYSSYSQHVILISIDGLHPDMYLDPGWPAPNMRQLMKKGTYADHMLSVFPSYTYPSHTAMLTGDLPARSGIYFNQPKGSKGEWNWFTSEIKVPTLWQALRKAGMTTAAVEWPVSVGKDITYVIPEIWSDEYPDRITESRKYATAGLVEEIERRATGKLDSTNMNEDYFSMDDNSARMAAYIFKTYHPALLAVHFAEVDGREHEFGRDADGVRLALAAADHAVGVMLEAVERSPMKDSTTVIIVGDHGFMTIHNLFRPNLLIKNLPVKFTAAGGSAFLYFKPDEKEIPNFEKELPMVIEAVTDSLNKLPGDKRKLFRIINRNELDEMGADSSAMLALAAVPGTVFSSGEKGDLFATISGGHHGYDPNMPEMYTGFIASGAGISKGGKIQELCVTDIAPLIAKLLGIDFKVADGRFVPGIMSKN